MTIAEAVTGTQDTPYYFKWSDFTNGISGTVNETVSIQTLPANGVLSYFNGTAWVDLHSPILVSQQLTKTMIDAGQVKFTPAPGESGIDSYNNPGVGNGFSDYAHFLYTTIVNGNQVKNNLMDVDIAPVKPVSNKVTGVEDTALALHWADFSNAAGAAADSVTVTTLPANGTLVVNHAGTSSPVALGTVITKADLDAGNVTFVPAANQSGEAQYGVTGVGNMHSDYAQFGYTTKVGASTVAGNSMTVDIAPVVDMTSKAISIAQGHHSDCMPTTYLADSYNSVSLISSTTLAPIKYDANVFNDYYYFNKGFPGGSDAVTGYWAPLTITTSQKTVDTDGSEQQMVQLHVNPIGNSLYNANALTFFAMQDGTIIKPDANGDYWVPMGKGTSASSTNTLELCQFQEWFSDHGGKFTASNNTVTATVWNCEMDGKGTSYSDILAKTKCGSMTSGGIIDPLVLDLTGAGIHTTSSDAGTHFDLNASGSQVQTGWIAKGNGLLALDLNGDGKITSGAELFGDHTRLANGQTATDGYQALAQYDTNHDGQITAADAIFGKLRVWVDANGDGVSQASELKTLAQLGIMSIGLAHDNSHTAQNGNDVALAGSYTLSNGVKHDMADVFFNTVTPIVG